jgi:hypothetical protein
VVDDWQPVFRCKCCRSVITQPRSKAALRARELPRCERLIHPCCWLSHASDIREADAMENRRKARAAHRGGKIPQCLPGYRLTKPSRFGIFTFGNVSAFITSLSPMILLSVRMYAVTA